MTDNQTLEVESSKSTQVDDRKRDRDFGDSCYGEDARDGSIPGGSRKRKCIERKPREKFLHPMSMKNYQEIRDYLLNKINIPK